MLLEKSKPILFSALPLPFPGAAARPIFMIKQCEICGEDFHVWPYAVKRGRGKVCSIKCSGVWKSINKSGANASRWKGGKVKSQCCVCKKDIEIFPNKLANKAGIFCSHTCYWKWLKINTRGENGPGWMGGITNTSKSIRTHSIYNEWRTGVFERDNYTCVKCGKRGGFLHAHHLKKFSAILNDIKQRFPLLSLTDIAENYYDLWDLKNGATLCKECHKLIHRRKKK